MIPITEQKHQLRKQMHIKRSRFPKVEKEQYDQLICETLWDRITEHKAEKVHCYLPMGTEINIVPIIEKMLAHNIVVVTPKTLPKRKLQNLVLHSLSEVEQGVYGTTHPANSTEYLGTLDLIIVPGLAFNDSHYRLGYGGGYYDNFLVQFAEAYKLGIFYPFQKVEILPLEDHDVQLDDVLVV